MLLFSGLIFNSHWKEYLWFNGPLFLWFVFSEVKIETVRKMFKFNRWLHHEGKYSTQCGTITWQCLLSSEPVTRIFEVRRSCLRCGGKISSERNGDIQFFFVNRGYGKRTVRMWIGLTAFYWLLLLLLAFTTHLRVLAFSFLRFRDHTQWHNTVGRTPLDEGSTLHRDTQHS
jgi:hypothetical protein